jgi:hypothetical protein
MKSVFQNNAHNNI